MFGSGVVVTFAALLLSRFTDDSPMRMVCIMNAARMLRMSTCQHNKIRRQQRCANLICHLVFGGLLFIVGFIVFIKGAGSSMNSPGLYVAAYTLTGLRFGRMAANGFIGPLLSKLGVRLYVRLGHSDGVGGMAMVGNFFLRQISPLIIPLVWISYWLITIMISPGHAKCYGHWLPLFGSLFLLVVVVSILGVGLPMCGLRKLIEAWRLRVELQRRIEFEMGREEYCYAMATMPRRLPIAPESIRTAVLSVVVPVVLATSSALLTGFAEMSPPPCEAAAVQAC